MLEETEACMTIKDHKNGFRKKIPGCLINPSKLSNGKSKKVIVDRINEKLISSVAMNQWKNTSTNFINSNESIEKYIGSFRMVLQDSRQDPMFIYTVLH